MTPDGPEVEELSRPRRDTTDLVIGSVLAGRDDVVPARIDAGGFDRHTFLCGQSGSGKVVPTPTFVRFGARVSEEGGSDVPTNWARSRA